MTAAMQAAVSQMYTALGNLPCGCCRRWDKEQEDGYTVTNECTRCRARKAYEVALAAAGEIT